ncbi:MAG: class I SAM-dependent methyltransferase, partial [Candidatus Nanoarchaeia archaeon]|nr:class I SAM-dependent methyltransferase [Candidatus Jingweiarchaeum tengchongense]
MDVMKSQDRNIKISTHSDETIEKISLSVLLDEYDDEAQNVSEYEGKVSGFEELRYLYKKFTRPGRKLDIGTGSGTLLELLEITHAIEPNPKRYEKALKIGRDLGIEVVQGFAESIPYPEEYFSTVLAWGVMCFVRSESETLVEVNRVLEEGGRFIFDVVESSNLKISKQVNPFGFSRWAENFGFKSLLVLPLE